MEVTFLPFFLLDLEDLCYACLPFTFELLGETEANCGGSYSIDCHHGDVFNLYKRLPVCPSPSIV